MGEQNGPTIESRLNSLEEGSAVFQNRIGALEEKVLNKSEITVEQLLNALERHGIKPIPEDLVTTSTE